MDTYVLNLWTHLFALLRYLSPYYWAYRWLPQKIVATWGFSDSWVLGFSIVAVIFVLLIPISLGSWLAFAALIIGGLRVLEIIGYLFNVLLLSTSKESPGESVPPLLSARRSLVLALHNYIEIVLWFAVTYSILAERFIDCAKVLSSSVGSVYFSVVTMTTLGYGDVTPTDSLTWALVTLQTAIGLFMVLVVVGWIIGLLPKRKSIDQ